MTPITAFAQKQRMFSWLVAGLGAFALVPTAGSTNVKTHPPRIIAAPRISGLAVQGQLLFAFPGRWSGHPTKYRYAWQRCSKRGKSCRRAVGAKRASHLVSARDVGHRIRLVVTAFNRAGARSASSARTAVVGSVASPAPMKSPPPPSGYFSLQPVGTWSRLPSDSTCATRVHRSSWEPRPDNYKRNHIVPDAHAVHVALAARPLARGGNYDQRWDSWLLRRVDGQFTGTTDEIFQWASCKWGLADNVLRAIAVRESTWYQYETYRSGRCVNTWGCGDLFSARSSASAVYCDTLAQYGYDYQPDLGPGLCPKTFSIVGVMSWEAPSWGVMPGNQNGTFPFNRNSTAFAVDYLGSELRGCYEGWERWLTKARGDIWGCVGAWYSGDWHSGAADGYISRVQREIANHTWLKRDWPSIRPPCSSTYGCPGPDPL
jgi:hypothetical protein